jgi:hypothetical protein
MQTLKLFVSLPDAEHPDMELRLSANDSACDVVIALPSSRRSDGSRETEPAAAAASSTDRDDYELGGYAGI